MLCAAAWFCRFHSLRPTGCIGQVGVELFTRSDQVDWVGSAWVKSLKPNCEKDDPVHTLHLNSEKSVTLHFLLVTPGQAQGYIAPTHPHTHTIWHKKLQASFELQEACTHRKSEVPPNEAISHSTIATETMATWTIRNNPLAKKITSTRKDIIAT